MKHTDIINSLSLEQKCALLSGGTVFTTRALPGKSPGTYPFFDEFHMDTTRGEFVIK